MNECKWCGSWRSVRLVRIEGRADGYLCSNCWGIYRETGERPPAYRMRNPDKGPITGTPLDLRRRAG